MKYITLFIACTIAYKLAFTQVVMNLQLPPAGIVTKEQLWNLSLVNPSGQDLSVQLEMQLTDVSNNQRVLSGITKEFILPKGVKQVRQADIMPISYNVINTSYPVDANSTGFLPTGIYNVCFSVITIDVHGNEILSDECETIEIEPLGPPALVLPSDMEEVDVARPLFTWTPPAPVNLFSRLNYDFTLVEILPTQTPADAIQQNIPLCFVNDINFTNFQYPATLRELDTSKLYAWRVKAKNNTQVVANSEIWSFTVLNREVANKQSKAYSDYTKLVKQQDPSPVVCKRSLNYEYDNEINDTSVILNIYDITGPRRSKVLEINEFLDLGRNFKNISLLDIPGFVPGRVYLLELINSKKEKWHMKFEFKKK